MPTRPPARLDAPGLWLRRVRQEDAALLASVVPRELDHLAPFLSWARPEGVTLQALTAWCADSCRHWADGSDFVFLAVQPDGVGLLGIVALHRRVGPEAVSIGYWFCRDATGRGLATAAVRAVTTAALALPDVLRVEIHCDETNRRSAKIPLRLGYRLDRIDDHPIAAPAETGRRMIWITP